MPTVDPLSLVFLSFLFFNYDIYVNWLAWHSFGDYFIP